MFWAGRIGYVHSRSLPNPMTHTTRIILGVFIASLAAPHVFAADPAQGNPGAQNQVITLSPFTVDTSQDEGYKATNAVSGTRLNTPIQTLPESIEVITQDFMSDIGALNLREALQYSAGIQLTTQNDLVGTTTPYSNIGGVNNAQGSTGNKTQTSIVMRGFVTTNALQDGFNRQFASDTIGIERVEVVRGPAALLYGIGNFGGVVNYLPKAPVSVQQGNYQFTFGSYGLVRGALDLGGPIVQQSPLGEVDYRLTASLQQNGDYTQYFKNRNVWLSPSISLRPWAKTLITIYTEYDRQLQSGDGFDTVRGRATLTSGPPNDSAQAHAGFIGFPGQSRRTMRWSGPDTYNDSYEGNFEVKLNQEIAPNLNLLAGLNFSSVTFNVRDVDANLMNNIGPPSLWSTVYPVALDPLRGDTDASWTTYPEPNSIAAYQWKNSLEGHRALQSRVELNYQLNLFAAHRWLAVKNDFLGGISTEKAKNTFQISELDPAANVYDYKSAADASPFSYTTQGGGAPSLPLKPAEWTDSTADEVGEYFIYQGKFLNGLVTLLGGVRHDANSVSTGAQNYDYTTGAITSQSYNSAVTQKDNTRQGGISISPVRDVSFYAVYSQGLEPNFNGGLTLSGTPVPGVKATNREFGVKFELLDGRISGTISHYRITRTGQPNTQFWWAPQIAKLTFNPNQPTVYNITGYNPTAVATGTLGYTNNYIYFGDLTKYAGVPALAQGSTATAAGFQLYQNDGMNAQRTALVNDWNAAVAGGAVSFYDNNKNPLTLAQYEAYVKASPANTGYTMLNASNSAGATYFDDVYNYTRQSGETHVGSDDWPGYFFNESGPGINNATQDTNSNANPAGPAAALETDRNTGWDGQIILSPTDNWQIVLSGELNHHQILSLGQFPTYPYYAQDRWAQWLFPNGQWGLSGFYKPNQQYKNEKDSSTFQFLGLIYPGVQGQDYPKWSYTVFSNYHFGRLIPALKGFSFGAGVQVLGPEEYESGYTPSGDALKDLNGLPLILDTPTQVTVNLTAKYEFNLHRHSAWVQVNVDNLLNDQHLYGNIYAPGTSARFTVGMKL